MAQFPVLTSNEHAIYAALELSKNSWLLAIQAPGRGNPSLHPIKGGDAEGLMTKLDAVRDRVAKVTGQTPTITLCYEAGYDGFWLARFLKQRGVDCLVMDPASLQIDRRALDRSAQWLFPLSVQYGSSRASHLWRGRCAIGVSGGAT